MSNESLFDVMQLNYYTDKDEPDKKIAYRLFVPECSAPKDGFPIFMYMHGAGERGEDGEKNIIYNDEFLKRIIFHEQDYPCIVLAPQCPEYFKDGHEAKWVNALWDHGNYTIEPDYNDYLSTAFKLFKKISSEYKTNPDKTFITGISMGGYASWGMITRYPGVFKAAAIVCGGGNPTRVNKIADTRIWLFHSDDDDIVPVKASREMYEAARYAGIDIKYNEYSGLLHNSWRKAYSEPALISWFFE